jgi:hypothetical protein
MAYQQHSVRLYCSISLPSQLLCNSSSRAGITSWNHGKSPAHRETGCIQPAAYVLEWLARVWHVQSCHFGTAACH